MQNREQIKNMIHLASKTINEQQEYIDSYVACLDILAFKTIIRERSAQDIKTIYNEIRMVDTLFCGTELLNSVPQEVRENLKMTFLSDSIIISITKDINLAFYGLLLFCMLIQHKLLGLRTPILCRGAICVGDFYRCFDKETDASIIFGSCLNEAYLLQEEVAIYPRIIIQDVLFDLEKKKLPKNELAIVNTFTKRSEDAYWFVDYLKFRMIFLWDGFVDKLSIKKFIKTQLLENHNERIKQKYLWLKEYYNESLVTVCEITGRMLLDEYRIR